MPAGGVGRDLVGHVDPQTEQGGTEGLAQVVGPQRPGCSPTERVVHHELGRQHVGGRESLGRPLHQAAEVLLDPRRRHFGADRRVGRLVVGEE